MQWWWKCCTKQKAIILDSPTFAPFAHFSHIRFAIGGYILLSDCFNFNWRLRSVSESMMIVTVGMLPKTYKYKWISLEAFLEKAITNSWISLNTTWSATEMMNCIAEKSIFCQFEQIQPTNPIELKQPKDNNKKSKVGRKKTLL